MTIFKKRSVNLLIGLLICTISFSLLSEESEREENESEHINYKTGDRRLIATPQVINQKFKAECSSCHMLYPAGLLPARSWTKIMNSLDKHFGEDATVDEKTKNEISKYLIQYSSDQGNSRKSQMINKTIASGESPIRISQTDYFKRKHHEVNASTFKRKPIGSPANCIACHAGAEKGNFNEHEVNIPKENAPIKPSKKK